MVPVPPGLTPEAASTVPTVFLTADMCLNGAAALAPGKRVLIHAAAGGCSPRLLGFQSTRPYSPSCLPYPAGGLGLAAIQVAGAVEAIPIGTAGNTSKRTFLRTGGGLRAVANSRSTGENCLQPQLVCLTVCSCWHRI